MAIYTVHVPGSAGRPAERADRTAFVRDGFSGRAALFGPLFLLRHRAWIPAALWLLVVMAGAWLTAELQVPAATRVLLLVLLELFVGLEGNALRGLALRRRGYDLTDVVAGAGREDGELAFFRGWRDDAVPASLPLGPDGPAQTSVRRPPPPAMGSEPVIGLFPSQDG